MLLTDTIRAKCWFACLLHRPLHRPKCTIQPNAAPVTCFTDHYFNRNALQSNMLIRPSAPTCNYSDHTLCSAAVLRPGGACSALTRSTYGWYRVRQPALVSTLQCSSHLFRERSQPVTRVSVRCCCADCTYKHGYLMHRHPKVTRFVYVYVLSFRCVLLNHLLPPNIPNKHPRLPHCARTWNTDDGSLLSIGVPPRCALSG